MGYEDINEKNSVHIPILNGDISFLNAVAHVLLKEHDDVIDWDFLKTNADNWKEYVDGVLKDYSPEQVQDPLFGRLGNAGTAFAPIQLAAALEAAAVGDRILVASYGDGAEALSFEVTEAAGKLQPPRGVSWHLDRRRTVPSYSHYLAARGLGPKEWADENGPGLSATIHFRERDDDIAFRGQRCRQCNSIQFPAQPVCETCFARDEFDSTRLAHRCGRVVTYTLDYFFPTPDPPTVVSVVDIDGARVHLQVADCPPEDVEIGMALEFSFRRIHEAGGRPNYFWKGVPRA